MSDEDRNYQEECGDYGGSNRDGDPCGRPAGWGTDFDTGKCKHHRGTSPDGSSHEGNNWAEDNDGGAPENNGNAVKHNLKADKSKWFERQDEATQADVIELWETWLVRANDPDGARSILWDAAINEFVLGDADEYLAEHGFITEQVVDVDEEGNPITVEEENPALLPRSRLQKDTLKILDKTGVLSSAEDRKADQMGSLATLLSDE